MGALIALAVSIGHVGGVLARSELGEGAFCRFDLRGPRLPNGLGSDPVVRHCTCLADVEFFVNGDSQYDQAVMWRGAGLAPGSGMFAEYFETPESRPGAICMLVLYLTDISSGVRTSFDLIVWDDEGGRPGDVAGMLTGLNLLSVAPFPAIGVKSFEVYERQPIGVEGGFWVGIRGNWDPADCSVLLPVDTVDEDPAHPAVRRSALTYVGPGVDELSEGWHALEELLGAPAATGINAVVGWCPVPVRETSWGEVKRYYEGDR